MFTSILVPSDGSPVATLAAQAAIELACACGASVVALSVALPDAPSTLVEGGVVLDPGQQNDAVLAHAHQAADRVARSARLVGVDCSPVVRSARDAAQAIVDVARERHCDLVVMGSHGRRGLSRLLAGSVTQEVLARSQLPVMVFRPARPDGGAGTPVPHGAIDAPT